MQLETRIELPVVVHFNYHPGRRGHFEPGGCQIDPDEPAQIEIIAVTFAGQEVELDAEQQDRLERECLEDATINP